MASRNNIGIDEAQFTVWRQEQQDLAKETVVVPDNFMKSQLVRRRHCNKTDPSVGEDNICTLMLDDVRMANEKKRMLFGGVDISFAEPGSMAEKESKACAVYVITDISGKVLYEDSCIFCLSVPYVPGFLAFREITPYVQLIEKQKEESPHLTPDVILVDGNGILHPRRAGIACFVGVRTGIPAIGVAKTFYDIEGYHGEGVDTYLKERITQFVQNLGGGMSSYGRVIYDTNALDSDDRSINLKKKAQSVKACSEPIFLQLSKVCRGYAATLKGSTSGDVLGAALVGHGGVVDKMKRTSGTTRPIYISVGHNISLQQSVQIVALLSQHRIPEPIRCADLAGRRIMKCM